MDSELREAIALYQDQLNSVAAVLTSEPHNEEALQLQQQLQEALDFTLQALNQAYGQEAGQQEQQKEGGPGEYQFNSDENLAIAAAAAAGAEHADPHGTGLADTAAAARAQAVRTTKNKRAAQGSPGAGENEEDEHLLVGSFELRARGGASNAHSDYSSDSVVAGTATEASQVEAAEEERRAGHLTAGPSGRQGHLLTGTSSGQVEQADLQGRGVSPSRRSSNSGQDASSMGGQHSRLPGAGRAALSAVPSGRQGRNNARMHPNNRYYREEPDFVALSESHPELRPYLTLPKLPGGRAAFNYASWEGTRQLTSTLLKADFGIDWWLPEGQLVPTVTNRANYVHWINDLLGLSSPDPNESGLIEGLDIGCGTNLIYCLLGAAVYGWRMVGVDVTDVALDWAERHIERNPHLQHLLEVRQPAKPVSTGGGSLTDAPGDSENKASHAEEEGGGSSAPGAADHAGQYEDDPGGIITPALVDDQETFAFSMCNPPFFESMEEANSNPATACGGTPEEMVYPGGEVAFIMRMMEDSVRLGGRIHWYTTMVGKKSTLKVLRKELHARHVTAIRTTELAQGKTLRWAIAWSFAVDPNLASVPIARPVNPELARPIVPKRSVTFQLKTPTDPRTVLKLIAEVLEAHGASPPPAIDQGLWRVSATVPHAAAAAAVAPRESDGAEPGSSVAAAVGRPHRSSSGAAKATKLMDAPAAQAGEQATGGSPPSATGVSSTTAAAAAASAVTSSTSPAEQQHKKPRSAEAPPAEEQGMASYKGPVRAGASQGAAAAGGAAAAAAAGGPGLTLRVTLFQVQRGMYEVCASVPNSAGLTDATRFTALMQRVQGDIEDRVAQ